MGKSLVVVSALVLAPIALAVGTGVAVAEGEPVTLSQLGVTITPTSPVTRVTADATFFDVGGTSIGVGGQRRPGACTDEGVLLMARIAEPVIEAVPDGFWPVPFVRDQLRVLCLDLRSEYVVVIVHPFTASAELETLLGEVRQAAVASGGAALEGGAEVTLPRTGRTVRGLGNWKLLDGAAYDVDGDVMASTGLTGWLVGVADGPCATGSATYDAPSRLFPPELGTVYLDTSRLARPWRAWACVSVGGASATLSVITPLGEREPPDDDDAALLRPALAAIARAYGVALAADASSGSSVSGYAPSSYSSSGSISRMGFPGQVTFYIGPLTVSPEGADRGYGGIIGAQMRLAKRGSPLAGMFDAELGYGNGEVLGEMRFGAGFYVGSTVVLDAIAGISAGSIGPGAGADAFVQGSLGLYSRGGIFWLGAMRAFGTGGPGHDRFELRFGPMKNGAGALLGVRYMRYGVDEATMERAGSAVIVTLGGGLGAPP